MSTDTGKVVVNRAMSLVALDRSGGSRSTWKRITVAVQVETARRATRLVAGRNTRLTPQSIPFASE